MDERASVFAEMPTKTWTSEATIEQETSSAALEFRPLDKTGERLARPLLRGHFNKVVCLFWGVFYK